MRNPEIITEYDGLTFRVIVAYCEDVDQADQVAAVALDTGSNAPGQFPFEDHCTPAGEPTRWIAEWNVERPTVFGFPYWLEEILLEQRQGIGTRVVATYESCPGYKGYRFENGHEELMPGFPASPFLS